MLYIGLDIGGTKIRGVLFDTVKNKILDKFIILTPQSKKEFLLELKNRVEKLMKQKNMKGIGLGLPGIVNYTTGVLVKAHNLPFLDGWNVKKFFEEFKTPVLCDNDSQCFLRAEFYLGVARGYKNIVAMTVGTGIGGGVIIDGEFYNGRNNSAGEFGHMIFQILNSKSEILNKRTGIKTFEELGAKKAFLKYGDRSEVIGIGVANLINSFNPDIVVLGGGGVINKKVKLATVKSTAKKYIMSSQAKNTPIVKGKLGDLAQAIGAALLFKY